MDVTENFAVGCEPCFVCDENIKDELFRLSLEQTFVSKTPFPDQISNLIGESYLVIISEDDKICSSCVSLINKFDQLNFLLLEVKNNIVTLLKKKYNLDEEGMDSQNDDLKETSSYGKEVNQGDQDCQVKDRLEDLKNNSLSKENQEAFESLVDSSSCQKLNQTEVAIKSETHSDTKPENCSQQKQTILSFDLNLLQANDSNCANVKRSIGTEPILKVEEVKTENNDNIESDVSIVNQYCQQLNINQASTFIPDRINQEITNIKTQSVDGMLYGLTRPSFIKLSKSVNTSKPSNFRRNYKQRKGFRQQLRPILPKIANLNDLAYVVQLDKDEHEKKTFQSRRNVKLLNKGVVNSIENSKLNRKTCKICRIDFETLEQFQTHMKAHSSGDNGICCSFCGKNFKTFSGVRDHTVNCHTKKFTFYCDFCGRGFTTRARLEDHRSGHTQESRWVCDVCGKRFNHQSTYWIHKKWHTEPLPYQCDVCGRKFKHTSLLAVHKRSHTGERPYKCNYCTLTFTSSSSCKRHIILHTRKFPFHCHSCQIGFTTRFKYTAHMAKSHGNIVRPTVDKKDLKMTVYEPEVEPPTECEDDHSNSTGSIYQVPYREDSSPNNSEHLSDNVVEIVPTQAKSKSLLHDSLISQVWLE